MMSRRILTLLCVAGFLWACSKRDPIDERLLQEEQELAEYIKATFGDEAIDLKGGAWLVKTHENPEGAAIEAGNYILYNWKVTNQKTEELEYTSDESSVKFVDSYVDGGPEITVVLSSKVDDGLIQTRKGEKGDIYIPSRRLFCDFQPRIFSVEIVDVIKDLSVYQEGLMYGYLRRAHKDGKVDTVQNVVSTIDKTAYNVMYSIIEHGTGDAIKEGMTIETKTSISYMIRERDVRSYRIEQDRTWSTKSGEKMNSMPTQTNCVGEILKKMNKKGKVVVAMSSKLCWEDDKLPKNADGQFYIPKWSVVVFTITIK